MSSSKALILQPKVTHPRAVKVVEAVVRRRPRRRRTQNRSSNSGGSYLSAYVKTLNDPYEFAGVPLGYDCFLPTSQTTAVFRDSTPVNADGSFSLVFYPSVTTLVQVSTEAKGVVHATGFYSATNSSSIATLAREGRVVSGGLRAIVASASTARPGVLYSGTAPDFTLANYQTLTTTVLSQLPNSKLGIGSFGASVTTRPYDNSGFEFFPSVIGGFAATVLPYNTTGYIAGVGFPPDSIVYFEAVLNLEVISASNANSAGPPSDDLGGSSTTLASIFPNPGQLLSAASRYLNPSVILDASLAAAQYAMGNPRAAMMTGMRSLTSNMHRSNRFNSWIQNQSRQSTVMIEEMKEDGSYHRVN